MQVGACFLPVFHILEKKNGSVVGMGKTIESTVNRLVDLISGGKKVLYDEAVKSTRTRVVKEVMERLERTGTGIKGKDGKELSFYMQAGSPSFPVVAETQELEMGRIRDFHAVDCGLYVCDLSMQGYGLGQLVNRFLLSSEGQEGTVDSRETRRDVYRKEILPAFDVYVSTDKAGLQQFVPLTETSHYMTRNEVQDGMSLLKRLSAQGKRVLYLETDITRRTKVLTNLLNDVAEHIETVYMGRSLPTSFMAGKLTAVHPFLWEAEMKKAFARLQEEKDVLFVYSASMVDKWFKQAIDTMQERKGGIMTVCMESDSLLFDLVAKYMLAKYEGFDWSKEEYSWEQIEKIVYPAVDVIVHNVNGSWLEIEVRDWA